MHEVARVTLTVLYWWNGSLRVSETQFSNHIKCIQAGMTVQESAKTTKKVLIANWTCEARKGNRE